MGRRVNAVKLIEKNKFKINPQYDLDLAIVNDIFEISKGTVSLIVNSFSLGYIQGAKAQKKGRAFNG